MQIHLVLAASLPPVSGAAIYDQRIAAALRALGHEVTVTTDPAVPDASVALVDGSALAEFTARPLEQVTGLIHHPLSLETNPPDPALKARETSLFASLRHIVTTSDQTAEAIMRGFGVPAEKITAILPGIDALPRSPGSGGAGCRILCLGQLIPRKGQDVLLRTLARLTDLDWHAKIAGGANDPAYAGTLHALAQELGIAERVTFTGEATGATLEALWREADIFALTSHYEGYGMVFAEALRRGLPVAATNVGAVPTLIGPECGVVCAPGDVEQMSKALRRLIFDQDLRKDFAETAWKAGQALPSWQDQARKLASVLA